MQDDAKQKQKNTGYQYHSADPGPGGTFHTSLSLCLLFFTVRAWPVLQGLLLRNCHHGDSLLLAAWQQVATQVSRQWSSFRGYREGQHVATVARQPDEDRGVFRGMWDGNDSDNIWVIWELRDRESCWQLGDPSAPWASNLLLTGPHLSETHRAACVPAV